MGLVDRIKNLWRLSAIPTHYLYKNSKLPTIEPGEAIIVPVDDPFGELLVQIKKENENI